MQRRRLDKEILASFSWEDPILSHAEMSNKLHSPAIQLTYLESTGEVIRPGGRMLRGGGGIVKTH